MWQVTKISIIGLSALSLSACASLFSAYDSEFSCKNSDHGGCKHPMEAYAEARAESEGSYHAAPIEVVEEALDTIGHLHSQSTGYDRYQDVMYRELEGLLNDPATPILAPARTVRTLILPYSDQDQTDRLFMPRYIYSVLEASKFIHGRYLLDQEGGLLLEALVGSNTETDTGKE